MLLNTTQILLLLLQVEVCSLRFVTALCSEAQPDNGAVLCDGAHRQPTFWCSAAETPSAERTRHADALHIRCAAPS
jgi:hypothetical protein